MSVCTCVYSTEIQRVCSELALLTVGTLSVLFFLLHTLLCFLLIGRYRSGRWQFEPRPRHRLRLLHDYLDFGSHHVRGTPADINDLPGHNRTVTSLLPSHWNTLISGHCFSFFAFWSVSILCAVIGLHLQFSVLWLVKVSCSLVRSSGTLTPQRLIFCSNSFSPSKITLIHTYHGEHTHTV